jgi:tetratricopeptide (TPR) repeat protein
MTTTERVTPRTALRWDFVTDPPTKLLADFDAARQRLRRGQYGLAKTAARRLLRAYRTRPATDSSSLAMFGQLAEIRACATAVMAIASSRLDDADSAEALGESLAAFDELPVETLRPTALALLGMVLVLSGREDDSVEPLVRAVEAGEDVLAELVQVAASSLSASGARDQAVRLLRATRERYPRDAGLISSLATALSAVGDDAAAAEASVAAGALHAEFEHFDIAMQYFALAESLVKDHALAALGRCQTLAATGRAAEALEAIRDLQRKQPQLAGPHAVRAIALLRVGRRDEAEEVVEKALELFPDDPWLLDTQIRLLMASGRPEDAVRAIDHALQVDNTDREWLCLRAEALLALEPGNADAIQTLQELAAAIPDGVTPIFRVTSALAGAGYASTALRAVERAIDDYSSEEALLVLQVELLNTVGRHKEAIARAKQALNRSLNVPAFAVPMAESLLAGRRYQDAIQAADRAIGVVPDLARAHRVRGLGLYRTGRYQEAIVDLDLARTDDDDVELDDALAESLTQVGLEADLGTGDRARRLLERAVEIKPTAVFARAGLAELLRQSGEYTAALGHANLGLEIDPQNPTLIGTRGQILHALQDDDSAENDLRIALNLDPELGWARTELGDLLRTKRQFREAIKHLQLAVAVSPGDPWPLASKGAAEYSLDHYDDALHSLDRALELDKDYAWAHGVKAAVLNDIDHLDQAKKHADRSLELDPSPGWVWEVRGGLSLLNAYAHAPAVDRVLAASARSDYAIALEDDPESWEAQVGLGECLIVMQENEEGVGRLSRAAALLENQGPVDADGQVGLGWCYLRMDQHEKAVDTFVRALALDCRHVTASFDLCLALLCMGNSDLAFEEFSQAVARMRMVRHPGRRQYLARVARRDLHALSVDQLRDHRDYVQQAMDRLDSRVGGHHV